MWPPPRADGLRFLRYVVLVLCIAVVALAGLLVFAFSVIQSSRAETIRTLCVEQNVAHDRTLQTLEGLKLSPDGQAATKALIEELAKRRDCDERAERLTR